MKNNTEDYSGYILETEDEINTFLGAFAMSPTDTGTIIRKEDMQLDAHAELEFVDFINSLTTEFPTSTEMSEVARRIF